MSLIQSLQLLCALCWLLPLGYLLPSLARFLRGRAALADQLRIPFLMNAATQVGFSARWLFFPDAARVMGETETTLWACLYAVSAAIAIACLRAHRAGSRLA